MKRKPDAFDALRNLSPDCKRGLCDLLQVVSGCGPGMEYCEGLQRACLGVALALAREVEDHGEQVSVLYEIANLDDPPNLEHMQAALRIGIERAIERPYTRGQMEAWTAAALAKHGRTREAAELGLQALRTAGAYNRRDRMSVGEYASDVAHWCEAAGSDANEARAFAAKYLKESAREVKRSAFLMANGLV
ncbi:MAG: hypothetical protein HS116_17940 [Planctomycetes bacterium]|nr:hypothetical protein [Planctomycetota bacterium]